MYIDIDIDIDTNTSIDTHLFTCFRHCAAEPATAAVLAPKPASAALLAPAMLRHLPLQRFWLLERSGTCLSAATVGMPGRCSA